MHAQDRVQPAMTGCSRRAAGSPSPRTRRTSVRLSRAAGKRRRSAGCRFGRLDLRDAVLDACLVSFSHLILRFVSRGHRPGTRRRVAGRADLPRRPRGGPARATARSVERCAPVPLLPCSFRLLVDLDALEFMLDAILVTVARQVDAVCEPPAERSSATTGPSCSVSPSRSSSPARFRPQHRRHRQDYAVTPRVRPMGIGLELRGLRKDGKDVSVEISLAPLQVRPRCSPYGRPSPGESRSRSASGSSEDQGGDRQRDEVLAIASHELRAPVGIVQLQVGILRRAAADTANELTAMRERIGTTAADLTTMRERMEDHRRGPDPRCASGWGGSSGTRRPLGSSSSSWTRRTCSMGRCSSSWRTRIWPSSPARRSRKPAGRDRASRVVREGGRRAGRCRVDGIPLRIEQVPRRPPLSASKGSERASRSRSASRATDQARVVVTDRGTGISPSDQARVFERFERAVAAGSVVGLGLGLYIPRKIVEAHGGQIRSRARSAKARRSPSSSAECLDWPLEGVVDHLGLHPREPGAVT